MPINVVVSKVIRYLQVKQMEWKDRRINFQKEVQQPATLICFVSGDFRIKSCKGICMGKCIRRGDRAAADYRIEPVEKGSAHFENITSP